MLGNYIPVAVMLVVSALLAGGMVIGSAVLGPRHPTKYKESPYECGVTPVGSAHERFPIKFYLIAMLFIIFDVETIFLYPWVVIFPRQSHADRVFLFGEMVVFGIILVVAYAYVLGKGALDWDSGREEAAPPPTGVWRARPPIRFGNERSGPVRLGPVREVPQPGELPTREGEDSRAPAPAGAAK